MWVLDEGRTYCKCIVHFEGFSDPDAVQKFLLGHQFALISGKPRITCQNKVLLLLLLWRQTHLYPSVIFLFVGLIWWKVNESCWNSTVFVCFIIWCLDNFELILLLWFRKKILFEDKVHQRRVWYRVAEILAWFLYHASDLITNLNIYCC